MGSPKEWLEDFLAIVFGLVCLAVVGLGMLSLDAAKYPPTTTPTPPNTQEDANHATR